MFFLEKDDDEKLKQLVSQSYRSLRVVGRGTVRIDPKEVGESLEFKAAKRKSKTIVEDVKTASSKR